MPLCPVKTYSVQGNPGGLYGREIVTLPTAALYIPSREEPPGAGENRHAGAFSVNATEQPQPASPWGWGGAGSFMPFHLPRVRPL